MGYDLFYILDIVWGAVAILLFFVAKWVYLFRLIKGVRSAYRHASRDIVNVEDLCFFVKKSIKRIPFLGKV